MAATAAEAGEADEIWCIDGSDELIHWVEAEIAAIGIQGFSSGKI
jgi:hypothetical protein